MLGLKMIPYLVIFRVSHFKPHLVDALIRVWPNEWSYLIVPDGVDEYVSMFFNYPFLSCCQVFQKERIKSFLLETTKKTEAIIIYSDDGAIALPQFDELSVLLKRSNSIGVFHPGSLRYDKKKLYSQDDYDTPDNYLCGAFIPTIYLDKFIDVIIDFNDRWLGHAVALQAIQHNISIYAMRQQRSILPNPIQISGLHVSKNRILAKNFLMSFNDVLSSTLYSPQTVIDLMSSNEPLSNFSSEEKTIIDDYLSDVTNSILSMSSFSQLSSLPYMRSFEDKNVVIFKVDCIGDVISTSPFYEAILNSNAKNVYLVTTEAMRSIFEKDNRYKKIIYLPTPHKSTRFTNLHESTLLEDLNVLREMLPPCDVALFPRYCIDTNLSRFLAVLLGIHIRIGFRSEPFAHRFNLLYDQMLTDCLTPPHEVHETERMLWFIDQLSLDSRKFNKLAINGFISYKEKYHQFVIGLGAASPDRRWSSKKYAELINRLSLEFPKHKFILLGAGDVVDDATYISENTEAVNLVGELSLYDATKVISESELYIGNDSGLMHIAAAVRTPVVEISKHPVHGYIWHANSPKRFGPWGVDFISIQPKKGLDNCQDACHEKIAHCINQISVDSVIQKILPFHALTTNERSEGE